VRACCAPATPSWPAAPVMHGVVALEQGSTLLDQFSPRRDDYL
jgi:hypothetical protein